MEYTIRSGEMVDFPRIMEIYAYARQFMADNGNPNQWGSTHPPAQQLLRDIEEKDLFVIENETGVHGVFFFWIGEDPTYGIITDGSWISDAPYGTIHRIAGDGSGGILGAAVKFALSKISHVRIDTHEDNIIMQRAIAKQGFERRGIIYLEDGSPRIAYELFDHKI